MDFSFNSTREFDCAITEGKKRVILTATNIVAWVKFRSTLTNDNVASFHCLSCKHFASKPLRSRVTTITNRTLSFLMCHLNHPLLNRLQQEKLKTCELFALFFCLLFFFFIVSCFYSNLFCLFFFLSSFCGC